MVTLVAASPWARSGYDGRLGMRASQPEHGAAASQAVFKPIQLTEVELGRPLPALSALPDPQGHLYERALALVRLHDRPIGTVSLDLAPNGVDAGELAERIRTTLGREIDAHLAADGLPRAAPFGAGGIASATLPSCIDERDRFLAAAPFASVVVATRERPQLLARCLRSLEAQVYPAFEIIVVDNAPRTDVTATFFAERYAASPTIRYVREDRPGLAAAHNAGLREIDGRSCHVAFTDDDVIADPYWLCELIQAFWAAENVGCVTGMIFPAALETWPQLLIEQFGGFNKGYHRRVYDTHAHRPLDPLFPYRPGQFGSGANMAFRTEVLDRIDGFRPSLGTGTPALGGDDLAAFFQVITGGHALVYEPAAIVHHTHYREYAALRRQIFGYGVGLTASMTEVLFNRPRLALDLAAKIPRGLWYAISPRSEKNRQKGAGYPAELTRLDQRGMVYGPIACLRSRRAVRRFDRSLAARSPRADEPPS